MMRSIISGVIGSMYVASANSGSVMIVAGLLLRRITLIALISLGVIFGSSTATFAEGNGGNKTAITAWKAENQAKMDAYQAALKKYLEIKKANEEARKAIATKFKSDADALRASTKAAVEAAAWRQA